MPKVPRSLYWQAAALLLVIALVWALSRFFPVVEFIAVLQQRVMSLGAWAAICYPLLCAACNVLLLPGGILAIGSGFFFGLWWGFFLNVVGNVTGAAVAFLLSRKLGRGWVEKRFFQHRKWVALDAAI